MADANSAPGGSAPAATDGARYSGAWRGSAAISHFSQRTSRPASWKSCFIESLERSFGSGAPPGEGLPLVALPEVGELTAARASVSTVPAIKAPGQPEDAEAPATVRAGGLGNVETFMLVIKSFIGTGILVLPKAFRNGGALASSLFMLFVGVANCFVMVRLSDTKDIVAPGDPDATLQGIARRAGGRPMEVWVSFSICFVQIAAGVMYMIFMGQTAKSVVEQLSDCAGWAVDADDYIFFLLLIPMIAPLVWIRNMKKLALPAIAADVLIVVGLVYLYCYGVYTISKDGAKSVDLFNAADFPIFLGTALFSFEGVCLVLPIKDAMADPFFYRRVLCAAMLVLAILYTSFALINYLTFGDGLQATVILDLPQHSWPVLCVQIGYIIAIACTYPLQFYPAVRCLEDALGFWTMPGVNELARKLFRLFLVALTATVAIWGSDSFDHFTALGGGLCSMPLLFVFPPLFHSLLVPGLTTKDRAVDYCILAAGVCLTIYTVSVTVRDMIRSDGDDDGFVCRPK